MTSTSLKAVVVAAPPFILPLLKIKKHIIYLFFCNHTVVAKAKRRHANPWNIDMIFMDVLCYDVVRMDRPSGQRSMNRHAKPVERQKDKKHV